jgi:predicted transcriptional regulator
LAGGQHTHATVQHMMGRGLIEREHGATSYRLTGQGRAVLEALLKR